MKTDTVTASEIGDWVYCPEAWRLAQVGTKPTAVIQARVEGVRHHVGLTVVETAATRSINGGRSLIAIVDPGNWTIG